jgi:hypothetical protein
VSSFILRRLILSFIARLLRATLQMNCLIFGGHLLNFRHVGVASVAPHYPQDMIGSVLMLTAQLWYPSGDRPLMNNHLFQTIQGSQCWWSQQVTSWPHFQRPGAYRVVQFTPDLHAATPGTKCFPFWNHNHRKLVMGFGLRFQSDSGICSGCSNRAQDGCFPVKSWAKSIPPCKWVPVLRGPGHLGRAVWDFLRRG